MGSVIATSPDRLESADRHGEAFRLRMAGYDFATIGQMLGYAGKQGAHEAVKSELERRVGKPCEAFRQLELARLDRLWEVNYREWERQAESGLPDIELSELLLKLCRGRGKMAGLLSGKVQLNLPDPTEPEATLTREQQLESILDKLKARAAEHAAHMVSEVVDHQTNGSRQPEPNI
jgi:hypothetical protein